MPAHSAAVEGLDNVVEEAKTKPIEPLFTYAEIAAALKVSIQTVEVWVKKGRIPSPLYIGVSARFTLGHLQTIRLGVQPDHTFPVSDSPRSAASRAGKTRKKEAKKRAAKRIPQPKAKANRKVGRSTP